MKHRIILFFILICVSVSAGFLIAETVRASDSKPDIIEIYRIKLSVEAGDSIDSKYSFEIIMFNDERFQEKVNSAVANYDTVIDFEENGVAAGKIIVHTGKALEGNRTARLMAVIIPFAILSVLLAGYYLYMRVYLYKPFKRLRRFASYVAAGNLDLPLPMDKDNLFGEFTESFDIMREELKAARQRAVDEEKSKKELIAALSHDIRTPVSIIRAAGELLEIGEKDEKRLTNIRVIYSKTSEIDTLVTDLFNSTLEDLTELKVEVKDIESPQIENIITSADPLKKIAVKGRIPQCLIKADPLRLNQVIGNIISNSYKYAGGEIGLSFELAGRFLNVSIRDSGRSLSKEELPLIKNKFYRGRNASGKQGAGLGLYICSRLLERMGGGLEFSLDENGFTATVSLALS